MSGPRRRALPGAPPILDAPAPFGDDAAIVREPDGPRLPVVVDSPHSGSVYPEDFRAAAPPATLREAEDGFVDALVADAPSCGATLVAARFPRAYVDPNREEDDVDPALLAEPWPGRARPTAASLRGVGLVWRAIPPDRPIYDRPLAPAEIEARIARCWRPFHDRLAGALDDAHRRCGAVWHLDCHSMWSVGRAAAPDPGRRRADFVLGDRFGASCELALTRLVADVLSGFGHSVALNDPFAGGAIVARHGDPAAGRHSLQIEASRALYMDEATLEPHEGFDLLRRRLGAVVAEVCAHARARIAGGA